MSTAASLRTPLEPPRTCTRVDGSVHPVAGGLLHLGIGPDPADEPDQTAQVDWVRVFDDATSRVPSRVSSCTTVGRRVVDGAAR